MVIASSQYSLMLPDVMSNLDSSVAALLQNDGNDKAEYMRNTIITIDG